MVLDALATASGDADRLAPRRRSEIGAQPALPLCRSEALVAAMMRVAMRTGTHAAYRRRGSGPE